MPPRAVFRPALTAWCLSALGILAGSAWLATHLRAYNRVLLLAYLPSLAVAACGCVLADRKRQRPAPTPVLSGWTPTVALLGLALVGVAGVARVWGFPTWPPPHGLGFEEEELGGMASTLLELGAHPAEHRLPTYAAALGFALFGPSISSLRLGFVAASALAPLLFLGACRRLARPPVALLCTALYAFSWWATAAGRFADEIYLVAPLTAAVVWLLLALLDTRKTLPALLLGTLAGALVYEYTAYRLVPALVAGYLVVRLAVHALRTMRGASGAPWRAALSGLRPHLPLAAVLAVGFSVSFLPAAISLVEKDETAFLEAFQRHTAVPNANTHKTPGELAALVVARAGRLGRALVVPDHGDPMPWMNVEPPRPNLGPVAGLVLGLGCLLAAIRPRTRLRGLLAVWIAVSAGTALAIPLNENTMRYFSMFPVAWLLAAGGLEQVWPGLDRPRAARAMAAAGAAGALFVATSDTLFLHRALAPDANVQRAFASRCTTTARIIGAFPRDSLTVLATDVCGNLAEHPDSKWLLGGRRVEVAPSLGDGLPPVLTWPGPTFFVAATTVPQPGLGRLLTLALPGSALMPADPWPHADLDLVALRLPATPAEARHAAWGPGAGGFLVRSFEGPPGEPSGPGAPPAGSTLIESHGEPFFTSLGQRTTTIQRAEELRGSPGTVYWVAWSGAAVPPPDCRGVRLRLRSGYGWLWVDGSPVLTAGYQGHRVVSEEKVLPFGPGRAVTVEACSYHIGNDPPALQVEWLDSGEGSILAGAGRPAGSD